MQLKVGLFIQGHLQVGFDSIHDHHDLDVFPFNKFYEVYNNYQASIIYPFYQEDIEFVLNFISNNIDQFLIIISSSEEIEKNSFLRVLDKIILVERESFQQEINLVLSDIKRQMIVNKQYVKFLYNLLNNNQLNINQKKRLFNQCESFKNSFGKSYKDIA